MRHFKSEVLDQELQDLLQHFLGSSRPVTVGLAVLALSTLGWFADSLYETVGSHLRWGFLGARPEPGALWSLLLTLPLIALLSILMHRARRARSRLDFRVVGSRDPRDVEVLMLFLSRPTDEDLALDLKLQGRLDDPSTLQSIRGKWRMPAEAIAFHAFRPRTQLKQVVLVGSAGFEGSQNLMHDFVAWMHRFWPPGQHPVPLRTMGDFVPDLVGGVDVGDLEALVQAFDELYQQLLLSGVRREHVVIDITGGTKLVSAAGVAVALAEGRRFQVVDTHDHGVTVFDPTYQPRPQEA